MSWIPYVVPAAITLLLIATTMLRRDLWPFSHYPMFAGYGAPATMRFFRLQFTLPGGGIAPLVVLEPECGDAFDREFSRVWPDAADKTATREIVLRFWREAARHRPVLRGATHASVMLRLAQIGPRAGVRMIETSVQVVDLTHVAA